MAPSEHKHGGIKDVHTGYVCPVVRMPLTAPLGMNSAPPPGHPPPHSPLQGYSFVAPSILFDHNNAVMADVLAAPGAGYRPGRAAVARSAMMQVGWPGVEMVLALLESSGLVVNGRVPPVAVGMVWV